MSRILVKYSLFLIIPFFPAWLKAQTLFQYQADVPLEVNNRFLHNPWAGGLNSVQFNKVDLDNDGTDELVVYDRSADTFLVYQEVNGIYVLNNDLGYVLPTLNAGWIVFADYNGDGKKDIFNNGERGIVVYKNTSKTQGLAQWKIVANPLLTTGFSGKINLIANAADIPGIADVDNDGDLDILVYDFAAGGTIRYNKNMSVELYHNADSLDFEIDTHRWGDFEECACDLFAFGDQTCADIQNGRVAHVGGKAILPIDNDGDGDKDLLLGHEECQELYFFQNEGDISHAHFTGFSTQYPDAQHPVNLYIFPAGFYEDVDFDGVKDLLVSPNVYTNIGFMMDLKHSSWLYHNTGENGHPDFQYVQNDFLQGDMLDLGERAVPALVDYDGDGDLDLVAAANGFEKEGKYVGYVSLLENTGTPTDPSFHLAQQDLLNLSSLQWNNPRIVFSDFNGDGALDLFYSGIEPNSITVGAYVFFNQAARNEAMQFDFNKKLALTLPLGNYDNPYFYDINGDGKTDLLIGKQDGSLEYYENQGIGQEPQFNLATQSFLGISRDYTLTRINLDAVVADINADGKPDMLTTDDRGMGNVYYDFRKNMDAAPAPDSIVFENSILKEKKLLPFGPSSGFTAADLFDAGNQSIVIGDERGGLQVLKNLDPSGGTPDNDQSLKILLYPNPVYNGDYLHVETNQDVEIDLINVIGQLVAQPTKVDKNKLTHISLGQLSNGVYILRARNDFGHSAAHQFVVVR